MAKIWIGRSGFLKISDRPESCNQCTPSLNIGKCQHRRLIYLYCWTDILLDLCDVYDSPGEKSVQSGIYWILHHKVWHRFQLCHVSFIYIKIKLHYVSQVLIESFRSWIFLQSQRKKSSLQYFFKVILLLFYVQESYSLWVAAINLFLI